VRQFVLFMIVAELALPLSAQQPTFRSGVRLSTSA
jgi:hypothetical protein